MMLTCTFLENETNVIDGFGLIVVNVGSVFYHPVNRSNPCFIVLENALYSIIMG